MTISEGQFRRKICLPPAEGSEMSRMRTMYMCIDDRFRTSLSDLMTMRLMSINKRGEKRVIKPTHRVVDAESAVDYHCC